MLGGMCFSIIVMVFFMAAGTWESEWIGIYIAYLEKLSINVRMCLCYA